MEKYRQLRLKIIYIVVSWINLKFAHQAYRLFAQVHICFELKNQIGKNIELQKPQ